ncbi:MAG: nucleoside deaminase [Gammaproteobacteria bacterium]|nr:nucleoside deaminase [Gammaproteobacteria bacterium]
MALGAVSVEQGGGPFGALVVLGGEVIGRGSNCVTLHNDPTAHAEVQAIREACQTMKDFSLAGATLYSSCEPCPMCLAASYWARLGRIVFAASRDEAAAIGFDDAEIYRQIALPHGERSLTMSQMELAEAAALFRQWREKEDKVIY